jgi:hypothetical protein
MAMVLGTPCRRMKDVFRTRGKAEEKIMMVISRLIKGSK